MLGIASQMNMEEAAKIRYIIDGIRDKEVNKTILYGAKSIKELKENLIIYEEQESRIAESTMRPVRAKDNGRYKQSEDVRKYKRCYNCGDEEHVCAECPNKSRGPKCFKCREYGYIASRCDNLSESIKEVGSVFRLLPTKRGKDVKIGNFELSALIDTGSELTLMRYNQYVKIGAPKLSRDIIEFHSIGSKRNFTLGKFPTDIIIDGELYHITIHVVPNTVMQHSLLIGTDFLDTVEINMKRGDIYIHRIKNENSDGFPEVLKVDIETGTPEVDLSRVENVQHKQAVAVPTSACLKDTVVMNKISLDESVAANITAVASGGNDTDGCDQVFVGCIEHRANYRVVQTNSVANSTKRTKSKNQAAAREFEVVRRRAINATSCRRRAFNKRCKKATIYKTGDLVAIERTQGGPGLKLHSKYLGPYRVVKVLRNDVGQREGEHEGPRTTSTAADHKKWWNVGVSDDSENSDEHI